MTDHHLRFIDRDEAIAVLASVGIPDGSCHASSVDHIGPIVLEPAIMDGDEELLPPVVDTRHHVNLRCREPLTASQLDTVAAFLVHPQNPVRVWG